MAVINYFKEKPEQSNNSEQLKIKKKGCYEIVDTQYPCIKKVVSKQGGYLVNVHLGRTKVWDEKKQAYRIKANNTVKHVFTEKEALKVLQDVQQFREGDRSNKNQFVGKYTLKQLMEDYKNSSRFKGLTDTYKYYQENIMKHVLEYFQKENDKYTCDITTNDIERYFEYELEHGNMDIIDRKGDEIIRKDGGISVNTLPKHKSVLKAIFKFAISCGDKYGVKNNVVVYAEIPKIRVEGYEKPTNNIEYHAKTLTLEELNITLQDAIENEYDHSIVLLIALGAIGGLRCSEITGLKIGHFFHNELINFDEKIMQKFQYSTEYYKQHEELMFICEAVKTINKKEVTELPKMGHPRITAIPRVLREAVEYALKQREDIYLQANKEIRSDERIYVPLNNLLRGTYIKAKKVKKRWDEYQARRNRRLKLAGKEPIQILTLHELRHTHVTLLEGALPASLSISWNVGHLIPIKNATSRYAHEPEPKRDEIIKFFDDNIKVDWSRKYNNGETFKDNKFNGSGHLRFG